MNRQQDAEARKIAAGQKLAVANAQLKDLERAAEVAFEASGEFKQAKADLDAKEAKLNEKRRTGPMKDRLDASHAFVVANEKLKQLRARAFSANTELCEGERAQRAALEELGAAKTEYDAAEKLAEESRKREEEGAIERDPILKGLRDRILVPGMSRQQVQAVTGPIGKLTVQDADGRSVHEFEIPRAGRSVIDGGKFDSPYGTYTVICIFQDDKLVRVVRGTEWRGNQ